MRGDYLWNSSDLFLYIHHTWKIKFEWKDLNLNPASKIIDYAGGKHLVDKINNSWKQAKFIEAKSFLVWILNYAEQQGITTFAIVKPVEDYVYQNFVTIQKQLQKQNIELEFLEDTQSFFLSQSEFEKQYKKPPIMEYFYRFMRKKENILMDCDGKPEWGEWNYDKQNRKFDKNHSRSWQFKLDKNKYVLEGEEKYNHTLLFSQPTCRDDALLLLDYFLKNHLDSFWSLEDAMYIEDNYVHHSLLSTCINFWFLSPREVVIAVENTDTAMNNKEWFIRQILWWREYMYHFFQFYKDDIYKQNALGHTKPLPSYFWKDAENSDMKCLSSTLKQVQSENFSHHIQRLMIIGNFSLLANLDPHELNRWFFEYYSDAFEWVVTPNVLGMSQYVDDWNLATKPYVASANYINKMSNYCKNCVYNPKEKYTDDACPFNYLYWNFVYDNKKIFETTRQPFIVRNLEKIDIEKIKQQQAKFAKKHLS